MKKNFGESPAQPEASSMLLTLGGIFDYVSTNVHQTPEEIFQYVVSRIVKLMQAKAGNIRLYDEKSKQLVLKASHGVSKKYKSAKPTLELGNSVAGLVFTSGRAYAVEDLMANRLYRTPEYVLKEGVSSLICLPLTTADKKLGVFSIYFPTPRKFTEHEQKFFAALVRFLAGFLANRMLVYELRRSYINLGKLLIVLLEEKDLYTKGHSERVRDYSMKIAEKMRLDKKSLRILSEFSILHDIGKIIIDTSILNKPDKLTDDEWEAIKQHPLVGERIILPVGELLSSLPIVKYHHERLDGKGYPEGLRGKKIPMLAKIIAVADSFDAMVSKRAYRNAMSMDDAKEELIRNAGKQFDAEIVKAMAAIIEAGEIETPKYG